MPFFALFYSLCIFLAQCPTSRFSFKRIVRPRSCPRRQANLLPFNLRSYGRLFSSNYPYMLFAASCLMFYNFPSLLQPVHHDTIRSKITFNSAKFVPYRPRPGWSLSLVTIRSKIPFTPPKFVPYRPIYGRHKVENPIQLCEVCSLPPKV